MSAVVTNDEIAERLEKHDQRMTRISEAVERIERILEPITAAFADIAAVGRVGRCAGNIIKWFAAVGLSAAAMWAAVKGWKFP